MKSSQTAKKDAGSSTAAEKSTSHGAGRAPRDPSSASYLSTLSPETRQGRTLWRRPDPIGTNSPAATRPSNRQSSIDNRQFRYIPFSAIAGVAPTFRSAREDVALTFRSACADVALTFRSARADVALTFRSARADVAPTFRSARAELKFSATKWRGKLTAAATPPIARPTLPRIVIDRWDDEDEETSGRE